MKHQDAVNRLKTAEGHIAGIRRMLEEDAYCINVIQQIQAVQSALNKASKITGEWRTRLTDIPWFMRVLNESITRQANRVIKLVQLDEAAAREVAAAVHTGATQIERLLTRHLADEEDLAVPIILHHKLRG